MLDQGCRRLVCINFTRRGVQIEAVDGGIGDGAEGQNLRGAVGVHEGHARVVVTGVFGVRMARPVGEIAVGLARVLADDRDRFGRSGFGGGRLGTR